MAAFPLIDNVPKVWNRLSSKVKLCHNTETILYKEAKIMNDRSWDRVSGIIVGAAIGFLAGILLAPSAGTETRENLKKKTQGTLDQVSGSVRDIRDNLYKKGQDLWKHGVTEISLDDDSEELPNDDEGHGA